MAEEKKQRKPAAPIHERAYKAVVRVQLDHMDQFVDKWAAEAPRHFKFIRDVMNEKQLS